MDTCVVLQLKIACEQFVANFASPARGHCRRLGRPGERLVVVRRLRVEVTPMFLEVLVVREAELGDRAVREDADERPIVPVDVLHKA